MLGKKKVVARRIPRLHTHDQKKEESVNLHLLSTYQNDKTFLERLVSTDETWFHYCEPESEQQSSQWKYAGERPPVKAKLTISW